MTPLSAEGSWGGSADSGGGFGGRSQSGLDMTPVRACALTVSAGCPPERGHPDLAF